MWDKIIIFIGGSSVLIAAVAWLTRSIITHYLSKDIEAYKTQLRAASTKELEHLKTELQIQAQRHQITFNTLHEKRALIIAELYDKVNELSAMAYAFGGATLLGGKRTKIDRAESTYEACRSFYSYFQKNKIYFSKELCSLIIEFVSLISEPTSVLYQIQDEPELVKKFEKDFYANYQELEKKLFTLKDNIEHEFRTLVGVELIK